MNDEKVSNIIRDGFIGDYMEYTKNGEAPAKFHLLTAFTILGTALGRRTYINMGMFRIYPNIYSLLVAPTGKCRKTTAINVGMKILRKARVPEIEMVGPKLTPEALVAAAYREVPVLSEDGKEVTPTYPDSVNLLYVPELAVLLNKRDFQIGLVPTLTDLFDCPDEWCDSTMSRGKKHLRNVFISTLLASTPKWLKQLLPRSAFAGGFMGRLFVAVVYTTERCFPIPPPSDPELEKSAISKLSVLSTFRGEYMWTHATQSWFREWYMVNRDALHSATDERIAAYLERKQVTLLKFTLIIAANRGSCQFTVDDMKKALKIIEIYEPMMFELFTDIESGDFGDAEIIEDLVHFFRSHDYIASHQEIMAFMVKKGVLHNRALEILSLLLSAQQLQVRMDGNDKVYRMIGGRA